MWSRIKINPKGCTFCDSTCSIFLKWRNCGNGEKIDGYQGFQRIWEWKKSACVYMRATWGVLMRWRCGCLRCDVLLSFFKCCTGKFVVKLTQTVKKSPTMRETWVRSLGWEDSLEEGMTTHFYYCLENLQYSCLENPHGQKSLAACSPWDCKESKMTGQLNTHTHTHTHTHTRTHTHTHTTTCISSVLTTLEVKKKKKSHFNSPVFSRCFHIKHSKPQRGK